MLGADLITWLYLFDDRFGEGQAGESQAELRACFAGFERAARTGELPERPNVFHHALLDLVRRGAALGGHAWQDRFADSLAAYMEGCAQELPFRRTGRVPSFAEYRRVELAHRSPLARDPADAAVLHEARRAAAFLCAWVNDVYSFPKEAADGDPLNLVAVLMHEREVGALAALDMALELYARDLVRFEALLARARAQGVAEATDAILRGIERYVQGSDEADISDPAPHTPTPANLVTSANGWTNGLVNSHVKGKGAAPSFEGLRRRPVEARDGGE